MSSIKVVARFRPLLQDQENESLTIQDNVVNAAVGDFVFDTVTDGNNDLMFIHVKDMVLDLLNGINASLLCYGQTGSGKTHTMIGNIAEEGLVQKMSKEIFKKIQTEETSLEFTVNVSFMEIYMEKIRDLLSDRDNLCIKDSSQGIYVKDLSQVFVSSPQEILEILENGLEGRVTAKTKMNESSSRSHAIFIIRLSSKNTINGIIKTGKLMLVDLAGSEKVKKTGATGQTLEEAKKINKSLSALGNVINALTSNTSAERHVPYRDSKLTRLLQDSIGGNSKTTLIVNCSPSKCNIGETISTLRFGVRAKCIKNHVRINQELPPTELKKLLHIKDAEIRELKNYSQNLEQELKKWRRSEPVPREEWVKLRDLSLSEQKIEKIDSKIDLDGKILEIDDLQDVGIHDPKLKEYIDRENELEELLEEKEVTIIEKDEIIQELQKKLQKMMECKINLEKVRSTPYINENIRLEENVKCLGEQLESGSVEQVQLLTDRNTSLMERKSSLSTPFEISQSVSTIFEDSFEERSLMSRSQSIAFDDALEEQSGINNGSRSQSTVFEPALEDNADAGSRDEFFEPKIISDKEMQKMYFLEQSLEQLSKIQKQLVDQNSELKKSMSISENKLHSRTEKIHALEKSLEEAQQKLLIFQNNDYESLKKDKHAINPLLNARVVKPLRGGSTIPTEISTPGSKKSVWYINIVKTPK